MSELTLTDFLLARIAEDEEAARDAYDGDPWFAMASPDGGDTWVAQRDPQGETWAVAMANVNPVLHIARHDPARVLAECEAKRRIVEMEEWYEDAYVIAIRHLAAVYASHPDYDEEWRP